MALVNPNIAMGYRAPELPQQNMLADYAAVQQIQSNRRQGEVADMQLEQMRRDQAALSKMQAAITAKGGPSDLNVAAEEMINSGIPEYFKQGLIIKQTLDKQSRFAKLFSPTGGAAPANTMYSPSEPYKDYNNDIGMTPSVNALAPAPTAAPNNAMADMRRKINEAYQIGTPEALAFAKAGEDRLKSLTLSASSSVFDPNTESFKQAPAAPLPPKEKINVIGVAKGTGNPVYLDSISDEQYIYVADADGKQKRKLYSGPVDRTTSNVTATANAKLPPLESAEQKGKGELNVNLYKVISDTARLATKTLPALETQAKILDSGFNTGFGTAAQKAGASVLSALGVPEATKFATDAQTFLAATQQAVLQKQLEQKGPQTESDAKRITDTGAQLGNTVDANRFIIDVAKAQFKRDLNQRNFFDKWWAKNTTYEGAENAWFGGEGGKSLFDAPELTKYVASKRSEADAILKRK